MAISTIDYLRNLLVFSLSEDMPDGDITTDVMIPDPSIVTAVLVTKQEGVFYGTSIITHVCALVDGEIKVSLHASDGDEVLVGDTLATFVGPDASLLKVERVMLNFIQRLSGVATVTRQFVRRLDAPHIKVLDTRKTTPLFRFLERDAVRAGGGHNHRLNLSDMVLIKENHLSAFLNTHPVTDLPALFAQFRQAYPKAKIEIEIESLDQLSAFDLTEVDYILLDNFALSDISPAVALCRARGFMAEIEVSGNVTLDTISAYRDLPIHRISVGSLTHSVPALDLSLLFQGGGE